MLSSLGGWNLVSCLRVLILDVDLWTILFSRRDDGSLSRVLKWIDKC